jgi:glycosyltransferase involved in cell wall biosynthesis/Tfp pilus assembly protein PilF
MHPKILMQNRPNAFTNPGGDTVLMKNLEQHLLARGVEVCIDLEGTKNLASYDLIHLFNFATPELTEAYARRAQAAGKPFIVTTLYEDRPKFFSQMHALYENLVSYINCGQPQHQWGNYLQRASMVRPSEIWANHWTASNAKNLIATGKNEALALDGDYRVSNKVEIVHVGREVVESEVDQEIFKRETGLKDFILCVGRVELRKNQLMLLKALENSELTVVFATGGFTYQPEYLEACRVFKRKGKTIFLGRLAPELLASAYKAARVHVLPSWYELPGLVSLEAAAYGTEIVVTKNGTTEDYFGAQAFYCAPNDDHSIRFAVEQAYNRAVSNGKNNILATQVRQFTWENSSEQMLAVYNKTLSKTKFMNETKLAGIDPVIENASGKAYQASRTVKAIPLAYPRDMTKEKEAMAKAIEHCERGDSCLRNGEKVAAASEYQAAINSDSTNLRAIRSRGVVELMDGNHAIAEGYFKQALRINETDAKSLAGLGLCEWEHGNYEQAHLLYVKACNADLNDESTVMHLITSSYALNKLSDLENVLLAHVKRRADNFDLQYCLAGCYYQQQKTFRAKGILSRILQLAPNYEAAKELLDKIEEQEAKKATTTTPVENNKILNTNHQEHLLGQVEVSKGISVATQLKLVEEAKSQKDFEEAIRGADNVLSNATASEEQKALAMCLKGEALACNGDAEEALKLFVYAEGNRVYGYRAIAGMAAVHASLNNWQAAEEKFDASLAINPDNDRAIAGKGLCFSQRGDRENSWRCFEAALSANSENLTALYGIIEQGYALNRLNGIEHHLARYLEGHPLDLSFLYSYAGCIYAQGKKEEAKAQLEKITLIDPQHRLANELLAEINIE